ncbi:UNVERIFIED_CONTAM: hypothetical protein Sindi_1267200 [Sesamum indicum]
MKKDKRIGWLFAKSSLGEFWMSPSGLRLHISRRKLYQSLRLLLTISRTIYVIPMVYIVVNLSIAHQQDAGTSRTQAGQTNNEVEEDDEDNFNDYETDENEYEVA